MPLAPHLIAAIYASVDAVENDAPPPSDGPKERTRRRRTVTIDPSEGIVAVEEEAPITARSRPA